MSTQSKKKNLYCATYHVSACTCELVRLWETRRHWVTPSSADGGDLVSSWRHFRHIVQPLLPGIMSSAPAAIDYNPASLPHSQSRNNLTWNLEKRVSVCCNSAGLSYPAYPESSEVTFPKRGLVHAEVVWLHYNVKSSEATPKTKRRAMNK